MVESVADIYTDFQGVAALKARARSDQSGSLEEVARQFESMLIGMMLKSMREANLGSGLMDNQQTRFYQDMHDQQLAMQLAEHGGVGLAKVLTRQLGGMLGAPAQGQTPAPALGARPENRALPARPPSHRAPSPDSVAQVSALSQISLQSTTGAGTPPGVSAKPAPDTPQAFIRRLWPFAQEAGAALGLQPEALLAQAALETGWGDRVIQLPNGASSHNLFGIKADLRWSGDRVTVSTLEYEQDLPVRRKAPFRAYTSYRESFQDYVNFVTSNPRYRQALAATERPGDYFSALQKAGYATDPDYAGKIIRIIDGKQMRRALQQLKNTHNSPI